MIRNTLEHWSKCCNETVIIDITHWLDNFVIKNTKALAFPYSHMQFCGDLWVSIWGLKAEIARTHHHHGERLTWHVLSLDYALFAVDSLGKSWANINGLARYIKANEYSFLRTADNSVAADVVLIEGVSRFAAAHLFGGSPAHPSMD